MHHREKVGARGLEGSRRWAWIAALMLLVAPAVASAKNILVFGPHEDDETFLGAGVARAAHNRGDSAKFVLVTNGDANGTSTGIIRQGTSVLAATTIGLTESDVIFLGYGDGLMATLYRATSGTQVYTSAAGQTATYGSRGLGGMDYHSYRFGSPASYSRDNVVADIQDIIVQFQPDEIYSVSQFDDHNDHQASALFIVEAIVAAQRAGYSRPIKFFQSMIWVPGDPASPYSWPQVEATGFTPWLPYFKPTCCIDTATVFDWQRVRHVPVPVEMQSATAATSLKYQAIALAYGGLAWYHAFARHEEFFWETDFGANIATRATVTASSEDAATGRTRAKAVDGKFHGMTIGGVHEWSAAPGNLAGTWIQLTWPSSMTVSQVNLWDRPSSSENVTSGTLTFSNGASISVGALPTGGKVLPVTFAPRDVTWVRFTVNGATGTAAGLAEIEVLGVATTSPDNVPPHIISGPGIATDLTVAGGQNLALQVLAGDLDGDPLSYAWATDAGAITGNGAAAVLTAPSTNTSAIVDVSVTVSDGMGGATTNHAFVQVSSGTGGTTAFSVSPSAVQSGASATGTVTIGAAAPTGGFPVALSSSVPSAAAVPALVTIPAGSKSTTFSITTGAVIGATTATITASLPGGARTASLTVSPTVVAAGVSSVAVSPSSLNGGQVATGTVTLTSAAPAGGFTVQLASGNAALVGVPASVVVASGATTATFSISTAAVATATSVSISATGSVGSASTSISLQPVSVTALSLSPASVLGGASSQGSFTLNDVSTGAVVSLTSSNPTAASVPASVTVGLDASGGTFTVTTTSVASNTTATITASSGSSSRTANLTITAPVVTAALSSVTLASSSVGSGSSTTGTVTLSAAAPAGGATVALQSSSTAAATVPASVVVAAGATTATFTVTAATVTASRSTTITATYAAKSVTASLTVVPLTAIALSLSPASVKGGTTTTAIVQLSGPAPVGGTVVTLTSSSTAVATVPASVTVAAGRTTGNATVTTKKVTSTRTVTISGKAGGVTRQATLQVTR